MANLDDADTERWTSNVAVHDDTSRPDDLKPVTTTVDGAKRRFDVNLGEDFSFQLQAFPPKFDFDVGSTALNESTDTSLKSITSTTGKVDFICVLGSNSNYEIIFKFNAVEVLRITMAQLGASLGLSNATNVPLWVETANKNFRYSPKQGVDFTTSFEVLAKATGTPTPTVNWLINYREVV